jgi:hypothetical protein
LRYDVAAHKEEIGCLSKSMVDTNENKLSEIVNYLRGYDANYNPDNKGSYSQYTFQFIENALDAYSLKNKMNHIVSTVIFDSLIGNGDRHQENWGFIIPNVTSIPKEAYFAPIYDSGSCLGRELLENKVDKMLKDKNMLAAYINRDRCEVRWDGNKKISHFELIGKIRTIHLYKNIVETEIKRVGKAFNLSLIERIVRDIDKKLPDNLKQHKLSENRKLLIIKFVSLRIERLNAIIE